MTQHKTIVLAAGGTGGHLYPAEALAQELLNRGYRIIIITDKRGQAFRKLGEEVQIECVRAATLKPGIISKISAVVNMGIGILQAAVLLVKYKPKVIVGFGGYPSFPTVFAGQRMYIPTLLHEQNAILGKANLWLAGSAGAIAASLPETLGIKPANQGKVVVTGNPVRAGICAVRDIPYPVFAETFEIFITGGSQAAKVFSDIVPEAVCRLSEDLKNRLHIVQQCRESDIISTKEKYKLAGVKAEIKAFFDDMPDRLSACHLFIGRSGASTVAEIAVAGRPAIFVPYPGHADQQQKHNANLIAGKNGGWVMMQDQFTAEKLADRIEHLAKNPSILENAAQAAKSCGQPEAVINLADLVEKRFRRNKT
ncbi:MAG: undecaprenyldiphospho-muramoylpentapeptide beta-N-acetylglucosaminyltransferase [Alphaproteobacteria bacterium]|nr:undecaprenyldiphospho-muramoylpentapeptide beta-N-acetylglucosaminyltransferase [Alphaproteobacteria bacterium]